MSGTVRVLVILSMLVGLCWCQDNTSSANKRGLFDTHDACLATCKGEHDVECSPIKGNGPQHVCKCASTFYSVDETCQEECENQQFWSLFTHGKCVDYTSTVLPGACNKQCVFRFRTWCTVFIIICFVAAIIIILATLPNCIINCIACLQVNKQKRAIEDMHVAGEVSGTKHNSMGAQAQHMAAAMSPWQQYPYYGYYGGARA